MLYEAISTLQLPSLSSPLIISSFWGTIYVMFPLANSTMYSLLESFLNYHNSLTDSVRPHNTWQNKETVVDGETSSHRSYISCLQTNFPQAPNYQDFMIICSQIKWISLYLTKDETTTMHLKHACYFVIRVARIFNPSTHLSSTASSLSHVSMHMQKCVYVLINISTKANIWNL